MPSFEYYPLVKEVCKENHIDAKFSMAVALVESDGYPFMSNGYPLVRFEKHVFKKTTKIPAGKLIDALKGTGYETFEEAMSIDFRAALLSTSFGMYQIMGFNYDEVGWPSVESMVTAFKDNAKNHIQAYCNFVIKNGLIQAVNTRHIPKFARAYNGPSYAKWKYDVKLEKALDIVDNYEV